MNGSSPQEYTPVTRSLPFVEGRNRAISSTTNAPRAAGGSWSRRSALLPVHCAMNTSAPPFPATLRTMLTGPSVHSDGPIPSCSQNGAPSGVMNTCVVSPYGMLETASAWLPVSAGAIAMRRRTLNGTAATT